MKCWLASLRVGGASTDEPAWYMDHSNVKISKQSIASLQLASPLHLPHGITQRYLPPGRCDIPTLIPPLFT